MIVTLNEFFRIITKVYKCSIRQPKLLLIIAIVTLELLELTAITFCQIPYLLIPIDLIH
jgi:hypothetical protein